MSNVEFDGDNTQYSTLRRPGVSGPASFGSAGNVQSGMARWLIKKGIVTSPAAAQGVLVAVVIINVLITFWIISYIL